MTTALQPHFLVDQYEGVYGPTILLAANSPVAVPWLQHVFRELAEGGRPQGFVPRPEVSAGTIDAIELVGRSCAPRIAFHRRESDLNSFVWSATPEGWTYLAELVQPFCDGATGHQYLTEDVGDAASIELTVGEQDVLA